jgi:hypothetical protein
LMMEAIRSFDTSAPARATRRNNPEGILKLTVCYGTEYFIATTTTSH